MPQTDYPEVLELVRTADPDARQRCFQVSRGQLTAFIMAAVDCGKERCWDASDTVQHSLWEARQSSATFRGRTLEEVSEWLQTIARHDVANRLTYQTRKKRPPATTRSRNDSAAVGQILRHRLTSEQPAASQRLMHLERRHRILAAIDDLPSEQTKALQLRHLNGLTLAEISERMNKALPAITGLLTRETRGISERLQINDE